MKIMPIVKIVFLSTVMLIALTLLTVDKPQKMTKGEIKLENLPKIVELVGFEGKEFNTNSIIKKETIIFVGNSQSIVIASDLENKLGLGIGKFVIVSNISDEPWFLKKFKEYDRNDKLKGKELTPWIYDANGKIRNYLKVPTADPLKYFVYKVNTLGIIKRIYIGKVAKSVTNGIVSDNLQEVIKIITNKK